MVNKSYDKIFDDLETAITFGEAVDYIAKEKTVTAGAADNQYPIFPTFSDAWDAEKIGEHHIVTKSVGSGNKNIYHVKYGIRDPKGSLRADVIEAQQQAEAYLNAQYAEIGPDTGASRA